MFCVLTLFLLLRISSVVGINYDEDISLPVPEVILNHSPINEPAPLFLTQVNNCDCREHPGKYVVCYGPCKEFPASLNITAPLFKMKLSLIVVLKQNDLDLFSNLRYLEIESNAVLETIQPGIFRNMKNLSNLTISFSERLKYLDEHIFEGLINLSTLCMQKNGFTKVFDIAKTLTPIYVPKLFLLRLDENNFKSIDYNEFHPMFGTKLEQLNMILCQIEYMHPDSLGPLQYLSSLRLGQNHVNSSVIANLIERSTDLNVPLDNLNFYGMGWRKKPPFDFLKAVGRSHVRFLHLIADHFDQLDNDSFPYMPNLVQLSLRGNLILDIASNAFKTMPKLESLLLTANRLMQVPRAVLLPTLKELDLAGNTYDMCYLSYFYIPDEIFKNMTNLKYLTLAYNNICFLTRYSFVGLKNLTKLNLKNCSLTQVRSGTFLQLTNLNLLNLMNNPFPRYMFLKSDMFQGLSNLEILLFGGCSIRNLTIIPSLFTYTPKLKYLGLEQNEIFSIGPQQFGPLINLQTLNIDENKLPSWNKPILGTNSSLSTLSATSNKFTFISQAMLEDWMHLDYLYLDGNPITCDCSLYSVVLWFKNHKPFVKTTQEDYFIASCVGPAIWRHKSIVNFLLTLNNDSSPCDSSGQDIIVIVVALGVVVIIVLACVVSGFIYRHQFDYWFFNLKLSRSQKQVGVFKYDVYVSHTSSEEWFTTILTQKLEPELNLCIPERDLTVGDQRSSAVASAVSLSRRPLLLVSKEYLRSSWCRWETTLVARKSPIVVQLETIDLKNASPLLRYLLKTRIYLMWPKEDQNAQVVFWAKLRSALSQ